MASEAAARQRMTLGEFLRWEGDGGLRYELVDGVPVAMTPPRFDHGKLVAKLARRIGEALDVRPGCEVATEVGVLPATRENTFYQADLAVSCTPQPGDQHQVRDPILIVEILSPSTEEKDRKVKLVDYRAIPSVREVLYLDCTRTYCELHRRMEGEDLWLTKLDVSLDASIVLESIGAELSLADLYATITFEGL